MDFSAKGKRFEATQKQTSAKESKKQLAQMLLERKVKKPEIVVAAPIEAAPVSPSDPVNPPPAPEILSWYGKANVSVYREDDTAPSTPGVGLIELINLYLSAAQNRTRHIVLMWPVCPKTLAVVHALATLERWARGDKLGVRGLVFPTKTNAFYPLNHLMLGREAVKVESDAA